MIGRAALLALALAAARDDPLAGRTPGPAADCLSLARVQGPDILDARTILYRQNTRRIWRTEPIRGCPGMRPGDVLIVELHGNRICRDDRFRVRSPDGLPGGFCRFGPFVPYDKVTGGK